jgi:hypothetical protein
MCGQYGSVGDYITTLRTLRTLLDDLVWVKPEAVTENSQVSMMVQ